MLDLLNEQEKILNFNTEELRRIADYARISYFKHLRLYDYVLNNKQLCEVKRITIQVNEPVSKAGNLNEALLLGSEEMLVYEDEEEELKQEIIRKKHELAEQKRLEEERRARQAQLELEEQNEESDEDLRGLDEKLKHSNLDKESKLIIQDKMLKIDELMRQTFDEKSKQLEEKLGPKKK